MSNRIEPKHFWHKESLGDGINMFATYSYEENEFWYFEKEEADAILDSDIAGFKIRPKTPQEQEKSIYYPKTEVK